MPGSTERKGADAPPKSLVFAAFAAIYLLWGSTFLGMRFATESIPPFLMAGGRYFIAGLILYAWSRAAGAARPTRRQWLSALTVGGALLLFGNGGATLSVTYLPSSLTALLVATVPMFMVIFGWWGGTTRRPPARVWLGLVIGFAGVFLLLRSPSGSAGGFSGRESLGMAIALVASAIWAVGSIYSRRAPSASTPVLTVGMQMLAGGSLLFVASAIGGEWQSFHASAITPRSAWAFGYLVFFGSLIGFTAYVWLLQVCDPAKVATYAFFNPVVAVFLGWALGGETIDGQTLVAAALIVVAVAIIITVQVRKPRPLAPVVE